MLVCSPPATCATSYFESSRTMAVPVTVADPLVGGGPQDGAVRPGLRQFVGRGVRSLAGQNQQGKHRRDEQRDAPDEGMGQRSTHAGKPIAPTPARRSNLGCAFAQI